MNYAIFLLCLNWGTLLHLHFYVNIKFTIPEASGGFVSDLTLICFSKKATKTRCHFFFGSLRIGYPSHSLDAPWRSSKRKPAWFHANHSN